MESSNRIQRLATIISCFVVLFSQTSADIPDYLPVCGRRNPDLNGCIKKSIKSLDPHLRKGIPEFFVPAAEPVFVKEVQLIDTLELKASAHDLKLWGMSNYELKHLNVDLEKQEIEVEMQLPKTKIETNYNVFIKLVVPVVNKGPIEITSENVNAKSLLKYKLITKNGHRHMFFTSMSLKLDIPDYEVTFTSQNPETETVRQAVRSVLGGNRQEILASITPNLEEVVSKTVLEAANRLSKNFDYDELFPDRE